MNRLLTIIMTALLCTQMSAQQEALWADTVWTAPDAVEPIESPQLQGVREATEEEKEYARMLAEERRGQRQIDRNLPPIDENGQVVAQPDLYAPYAYGWMPEWRLHKGLNVNVGASVFANFGGHNNHGAGFTQDVSLMYVSNLSKKATLAVGGYLNNITYGGSNYTTAGITALLGYRFNEHWSAYAFVQKAFNSNNVARTGMHYPYWGYGGYGYPYWGYGGYGRPYPAGYYGINSRYMDRIGAGVRYEWGKENQNSIEIQVEVDRMPDQRRGFYDYRRYDYPVR